MAPNPSAMASIVVRLRLPFFMMFRNEIVNHIIIYLLTERWSVE
jgi:hypothetical protein